MEKSESHFLAGKKIIVAGSGIAGLSFVIALRRLWDPALDPPEVIIYDRDGRRIGPDREGYSLALHGLDGDGGLVACRDLGLLDAVLGRAGARADGSTSYKIWDEGLADGRIRVHLSATNGPGVSRTDDCDLLIAADGAHSKVRASFRPDDEPEYNGTVLVGGVGRFVDGVPSTLNHWGMVVSGQGIGYFFAPVDDTGLLWVLSQPQPERTESGDLEALRREALALCPRRRGPKKRRLRRRQ
ncbi:monooxygenase [Hirsutella rhossiliensis]|uniref:Monooxygenase n=1 Tax=Hirsutella rhossiliensis TaxID=111463 RepID=A0A9P8N3F9_9HYPO|nr:monooxygenase [Hirsutella rhossiliensis]KAH0966114.1 monooxygenase [Hirsutella rhossiliensis]